MNGISTFKVTVQKAIMKFLLRQLVWWVAVTMLMQTISVPLFAQKKNAAFRYHLHKTNLPIKIDGQETDPAWQASEVAKDFYMVLPMDTSKARVLTEVRMLYDNEYIYMLTTCFLGKPGPHMVESLRRDFNFLKNDNFIFMLDPFDDQTNGFTFGVNAAGAQWDGMLYAGGSADLNWDNKWYSEVKSYADRWVFEAAIPFKTIRYKKGIKEWGVNFSRNDLKTTEKSAWAPVPRQFPTSSLAYTGVLAWDEAPPLQGANLSIIPYALANTSQDFEHNEEQKYQAAIGSDAKIAVTSSLNLDLTVNPDFSQVDVDRQVTNLDRFEIFFPERRQFFLENGDLFANFGYPTIRPFFSRRIGLTRDSAGSTVKVPILFGARLSGKINRNWRIGIMDMQTKAVEASQQPMQNFGVVSIQRRVFARSNIGFMFINKEAVNYTPSSDPNALVYSKYNRNVGMEYNLASSNNQWTGKALVMQSFTPDKKNDQVVASGNIQYSTRQWQIAWQQEYVGKNYTAEAGYVPRQNYNRLAPSIAYLFFPKGSKILSHGPMATTSLFFNAQFKSTDNETAFAYPITLRTFGKLFPWIAHNYVKLLKPFDPTNSGKDTLATGSEHYWNSYGFEFTSRPQRVFTYSVSFRNGGYFAHGTRFNLGGELGYRFQPYVSLAVTANYNNINLPETTGQTSFWLISPRLDVTLTNKFFITAFAQYNEQINNVNLNARLQWRYRPASDLFIVYTDNYLPENLNVKNRALVVKFTYWWSVGLKS